MDKINKDLNKKIKNVENEIQNLYYLNENQIQKTYETAEIGTYAVKSR